MASTPARIYCIDSSTLMNFEDRFPEDVFSGIWEGRDEMASSGRLLSHREVYEEIQEWRFFIPKGM